MSISTSIDNRRLLNNRTWIELLTIMLLTGLMLHLMGRVFWCQCGSLSPWSWEVDSQHNSQHLIDAYFFTHVLHGIGFFAVLHGLARRVTLCNRLRATVLLEAAWEILENSPVIIERYRSVTVSLGYYGDSITNSLVDILACVMGFLIAARLRVWQSVLLFVATEAALTVTIRDCLTLNVLMLVFPIEAIKIWQMGQ